MDLFSGVVISVSQPLDKPATLIKWLEKPNSRFSGYTSDGTHICADLWAARRKSYDLWVTAY